MTNELQRPDGLIAITMNGDNPTVSGRDLHERLGIATEYAKWFTRMAEYGFEEGTDFSPILTKTPGANGRPSTDHEITLDMAKQICMIQRTEVGRTFREYFLEVERKWNSPEYVMARALQMAKGRLDQVTAELTAANDTIAVQSQQIAELQPKAGYYDLVLQTTDTVSVSVIAKDYGMSAKAFNLLLHELGIQYRQGSLWLLYQKYAEQGYTKTKTHLTVDPAGVQHSHVTTYWTQKGRLFLYDKLKENGVLPLIERGVAS